jgi:hypothetical protein
MATKAEHITTLKASHSSLHRQVNGVRVALSDSEYEAKIDAWATANAATDVRNALIASGGESSDYAALRTDSMVDGSYPSIPDQLDMLFHDITDGKLDETGSWYLAIKATKDKFTKP